MSSKTIIIIDDHPLFREGLKAIIEPNSAYEVIGEAGSAREGLEMAKQSKPDLIIADISLPDQNGIDLTREIQKFLPEPCIMIVSMHSKIEYIAKAFQAGARGYVVKDSAAEKLLDGLNFISRGEYFLDSAISSQLVENLKEFPFQKPRVSDSAYSSLTPREQEIMRLMAEGLTNKAIAQKLFISAKTVENHRSNIFKKLNIHNTHELVRYAAKLGLIDVDLWKG